jgi:sirohydrochlorin cobaltochelatase
MDARAKPDSDSAVVLFAHGARDPGWAEPFRRIASRIREARPGLRVELAFLELMSPALGEAVAILAQAGIRRITLVPLFLAQGGHLKEDLPRLLDAIRRDNPGVRIESTSAIGDAPELEAAIADWALSRHFSAD